MEFGISCEKIDEIGFVTHAENLGYDFCWVTDSQMIRSNPWAVLALAAQQTRTIKLGTGVAVPGLRLAPVAANGIATINRLAPGRTHPLCYRRSRVLTSVVESVLVSRTSPFCIGTDPVVFLWMSVILSSGRC